MRLVTATAGVRGIDVNQPVTADQAKEIKAAGFDFIFRYVPREQASGIDLSRFEVRVILEAGLMLGVVQHVKSAKSWAPSANAGRIYGETATRIVHDVLRLGDGAPIWCDLEGVDPNVDSSFVDEYARAWHDEITAGDPGLYVGWHCGLSPAQLWRLPFMRYWGAYNLNADEYPANRGLQLKQHEATPAELQRLSFLKGFDTNTVLVDKKGDLPVFLAA